MQLTCVAPSPHYKNLDCYSFACRCSETTGRFVARETSSDERDRLFALAADLYPGYPKYAERTDRTIRMLRLAPEPE